ncbi:CPBP family intramembrane glutamic endopeptidase [Fodinicola acaciae]|uniref:CPBP family intramembrane glutamic endopeptidase n=1 Tax=Fodinicola acaciae TaxID=2681555 RepID=UPI0013D27F0C|nr:CPBP family intramembrane glutamic endopeptidase [Fodinicola acaciae]
MILFAIVGTVTATFALQGRPYGLTVGILIAQSVINLLNVVTVLMLRSALRREPTRFRELVGYRRERLVADICWGVLWLFVLTTIFWLVTSLLPILLFQPHTAAEFSAMYQKTFVGEASQAGAVFTLPQTVFVANLVIFAITNPIVEEMAYRAYAQQRLVASVGAPLAIALPAVAFGLQHTLYAFSAAGMIVFGVSFFCWGLVSGWIYHRQQRLIPLITAHFITNAVLGAALPITLMLNG